MANDLEQTDINALDAKDLRALSHHSVSLNFSKPLKMPHAVCGKNVHGCGGGSNCNREIYQCPQCYVKFHGYLDQSSYMDNQYASFSAPSGHVLGA
jgi:hypothetical protein